MRFEIMSHLNRGLKLCRSGRICQRGVTMYSHCQHCQLAVRPPDCAVLTWQVKGAVGLCPATRSHPTGAGLAITLACVVYNSYLPCQWNRKSTEMADTPFCGKTF